MTDPAQGFPAFAATSGRRDTRGRSWWARAWVQALEDTSLDAGQLLAGRRYANSGQVGTITVSPGRIAATVHGVEDSYQSVVLVDRLTDAEWQRFLDRVGEQAGHLAALLQGEMPRDLVEAAEDAGVALLPGIGDLDPSCTCDGWELPCRHAAALCYQLGWLLDEDPFVLLLIRGRARERVLDDLQHLLTTRLVVEVLAASPPAGIAPDAVAGTPAVDAYAASDRPALPEPPPLPADSPRPDEVVIAGADPPPGFEPSTLPLLVADAAQRAREQFAALIGPAR